MAGPGVGVVIPALNEARSVGGVVRQVVPYGTPIVVDDGSVDATAELAAQAGAEVVKHPGNQGYDRAIESGFARAAELGCAIVVTMDADGQHNPDLLRQFIAAVMQGADVVVGIRDRRQRLAETLFAWVARRRWGICDPLCGMKAYRLAVYQRLGHFDSYRSIGTELALFAAAKGYKVAQVPVATRPREGHSRFGRVIRGNWLILRAMLQALAIYPAL
jgi:glycosyltransferase involved in cell wall biosynthesis